MSFIQTELDHAAFIRPSELLERELWQSRPAAATPPYSAIQAAYPLAARLANGVATAGLPALVIPFFFSLSTGTPSASQSALLAALAVPMAAWSFQQVRSAGQVHEAAGRVSATYPGRGATPRARAAWPTLLGHACLTALLITAAAGHAAASIASMTAARGIAAMASDGTLAEWALPLSICLALAVWILARRGATPPLRTMLVIEGITIALSLIVLANYSALGNVGIDSLSATTPFSAVAESVGLAALSPILSAGIGFCCFTGALASLKAAVCAQP
ncbi:MAG TPA: hypothetical protein VM639_05865 [Dongiaceae bacterium]|nr:hypothetical protein [Dongiaceae bacterium]